MYRQSPGAFIGTRMSPPKPVKSKSDQYAVYTRADFFRDQMALRAPATESVGMGFNITYQTYTCLVYSLHKDIADEDRANTDVEIDLDRDATIALTQSGLIKLDRAWAQAAFTTGVWTGSTTGSDLVGGSGGIVKFSVGGSTPIETIRAQVFNLALAGIDPKNLKLAMGPLVWQTLVDHPELVARLKYTQDKVVTEQLVTSLLGIGEVVVGWGVYNSAVEGATNANYNFIMGSNMLLAHVVPPGLITPTSSTTFYWQGYLGNSALGPMNGTAQIKKFREERLGADRIEITEAFVPQITAPDLGVFFSNIV